MVYLGQLLGGLLLASATDFGQVGNDFLRVFSLSGTRFTAVGQNERFGAISNEKITTDRVGESNV